MGKYVSDTRGHTTPLTRAHTHRMQESIRCGRARCVRNNLLFLLRLGQESLGYVRILRVRFSSDAPPANRRFGVTSCRDGQRRPGHEDNSFDQRVWHPSMDLPTYLSAIAHVPCHLPPILRAPVWKIRNLDLRAANQFHIFRCGVKTCQP